MIKRVNGQEGVYLAECLDVLNLTVVVTIIACGRYKAVLRSCEGCNVYMHKDLVLIISRGDSEAEVLSSLAKMISKKRLRVGGTIPWDVTMPVVDAS